MSRCKFTLLAAVALTTSLAIVLVAGDALDQYDPETLDNIPLMRAPAPSSQWDSFDDGGGANRRMDASAAAHGPLSAAESASAGRRSAADNDLEDGLEEEDDDDRDEYKSGSTNHDSYENPAFGESRAAAREGDAIENFFDQHIGPQDMHDLASNEAGGADGVHGDAALHTDASLGPHLPGNIGADMHAAASELDEQAAALSMYADPYEMSASSPLTTIFHSLLHKRPLVITTSDDSSSSDSATSSTGTSAASSASSASTPAATTAIGFENAAAPIAYLAPMLAAPSSYSGAGAAYQPAVAASGADESGVDNDVREIYITRGRPQASGASAPSSSSSYMSPMSSSVQSPHSAASRLVGWRGQPTRLVDDGYAQNDYARYPVAASYAQQHQHHYPGDADEQTVTFGLSFGRGDEEQDSQSSADEGGSHAGPMAAAAAEDAPSGYAGGHRLYYGGRSPASSSSRAYNNYAQQPAGYIMANPQQLAYMQRMMQQQAMMAAQQQQQQPAAAYYNQQQSAHNGARYHKDPSESMGAAQQVNYDQYR